MKRNFSDDSVSFNETWNPDVPYSWYPTLESRVVLFEIEKSTQGPGFVACRVNHHSGDVLTLKSGLTIHRSYVKKVLADDEGVPSTFKGLRCLRSDI